MRTERQAAHYSASESADSDVDSDLSTQAQLGGRARNTDVRFEALARSPLARQAMERDSFQRTTAALGSLRVDEQGTALADKALVASFAMQHLYNAGLKPKLGGSLAVRLRGGPRDPKDVDIEMPSANQLHAAHERLTGKFNYKGEVLTVRTDRQEVQDDIGVLLDVKLERSANRSDSAHVAIDLVNENAPAFNRQIVAPERTGSPDVGTTEPFRLIVNLIDRRINKESMSIQKEDAKTIYRVLKGMGYHLSDPAHREAIFENVAAKLTRTRDKERYRVVLEEMLAEYLDRRSGRHKSKSSKSDPKCSVM